MGRKPLADEVLRTSITLPATVARRVKALADRRNVPVGAIVREFVSLGLERVERQEMLERIADAIETPKVAV